MALKLYPGGLDLGFEAFQRRFGDLYLGHPLIDFVLGNVALLGQLPSDPEVAAMPSSATSQERNGSTKPPINSATMMRMIQRLLVMAAATE